MNILSYRLKEDFMGRKPSWQTFEEQQAKAHRGKHVGGPGQPDYTRGEISGEVKRLAKPMSKAQLMIECQKGRKEIVCRAGFSPTAKAYKNRYRPGIKLIG